MHKHVAIHQSKAFVSHHHLRGSRVTWRSGLGFGDGTAFYSIMHGSSICNLLILLNYVIHLIAVFYVMYCMCSIERTFKCSIPEIVTFRGRVLNIY